MAPPVPIEGGVETREALQGRATDGKPSSPVAAAAAAARHWTSPILARR